MACLTCCIPGENADSPSLTGREQCTSTAHLNTSSHGCSSDQAAGWEDIPGGGEVHSRFGAHLLPQWRNPDWYDLRDGPGGAGFSGELSFMLYPQRPGAPGLLKQTPRLPQRRAAMKMEQVGAATSGGKEPRVSTYSICWSFKTFL